MEIDTAVLILAISREVPIVAAVAIAVAITAAAAGATTEEQHKQQQQQQVSLCNKLNANGGPQSPV